MAAMQYAGLVGLLALMAATPSFAQSRTTMPDGHPCSLLPPDDRGQRGRATGLLRRLARFSQGLVTSDAAIAWGCSTSPLVHLGHECRTSVAVHWWIARPNEVRRRPLRAVAMSGAGIHSSALCSTAWWRRSFAFAAVTASGLLSRIWSASPRCQPRRAIRIAQRPPGLYTERPWRRTAGLIRFHSSSE